MVAERPRRANLLAGAVADDLTGAAATGALLRALGADVSVVPDSAQGAMAGPFAPDVAIVSTASRHLPPDEAAARVHRAVGELAAAGAAFLGKRIDSTLRGNVGAELQAALEAWGTARRLGYCRLVVAPAYPAAGRTVRDGALYRELPEAPAPARQAAAPTAPTVRVAERLAAQSSLPAAPVDLALVRTPDPQARADRLWAVSQRARVLVVDAQRQEDIDNVAQAVDLLERTRTEPGAFVLADPGPAFAARMRLVLAGRQGPPVLVVGGSVTLESLEQLDVLAVRVRVASRVLAPEDLASPAGGRYRRAEARALAEALRAAPRARVAAVVVRTARDAGDRLPLGEQEALRLADGLGQVVAGALKAAPAHALVVTGGEVAQAVCRALGARRLDVVHGVEPLVGHVRIVGGPAGGLGLGTKGGLVGDRLALVRLVEHMTACGRGDGANRDP